MYFFCPSPRATRGRGRAPPAVLCFRLVQLEVVLGERAPVRRLVPGVADESQDEGGVPLTSGRTGWQGWLARLAGKAGWWRQAGGRLAGKAGWLARLAGEAGWQGWLAGKAGKAGWRQGWLARLAGKAAGYCCCCTHTTTTTTTKPPVSERRRGRTPSANGDACPPKKPDTSQPNFSEQVGPHIETWTNTLLNAFTCVRTYCGAHTSKGLSVCMHKNKKYQGNPRRYHVFQFERVCATTVVACTRNIMAGKRMDSSYLSFFCKVLYFLYTWRGTLSKGIFVMILIGTLLFELRKPPYFFRTTPPYFF